MGETRVDLLHLLEDLADAYPGELEETVLTEIIANALDSGASRVALHADAAAATLTVVDDGHGMSRAELRRFHDVAATSKARGEGIGFAGVGIKLGLLVSEEVLTETRRAKGHVATTWRLASRHRAPWQWTDPPGFVSERGTAVRLRLRSALSALVDPGFLERAIRVHFEPLLDPSFDEILLEHYPHGVRFHVNGRELLRNDHAAPELAPIRLRMGRRRKPSAMGYLARETADVREDLRGVAISTFGKVIKRGWDWLGVSPAAPQRVIGLIEAPALASCLTLNKVDFIRSGARGATYLAVRKALQQVVAEQLSAWGDRRNAEEPGQRRAARPVERDLEAVLFDLSDRFPLLATLVERRPGGQRTMRVGSNGARPDVAAIDLFAAPANGRPVVVTAETTEPGAAPEPPQVSPAVEEPRGEQPVLSSRVEPPGRSTTRRPMRLGLTIHFESRPGELELGRLVETTVWVNEAHPAYQRATSSRSEGYHLALSAAMALAGVAVEPGQAQAFVAEFLARWGESTERRGRTRSKRRKRASG